MKRTWIAAGVWVVLCSILLAQAPAAKNMIGTWKLNHSKFHGVNARLRLLVAPRDNRSQRGTRE